MDCFHSSVAPVAYLRKYKSSIDLLPLQSQSDKKAGNKRKSCRQFVYSTRMLVYSRSACSEIRKAVSRSRDAYVLNVPRHSPVNRACRCGVVSCERTFSTELENIESLLVQFNMQPGLRSDGLELLFCPVQVLYPAFQTCSRSCTQAGV
eukprot:4417008-Amphidinium_carterae.2